MSNKGMVYEWIKGQREEDRTQLDRLYFKLRGAKSSLAKIYWHYRWNRYCRMPSYKERKGS